jgi:hypothetical protein
LKEQVRLLGWRTVTDCEPAGRLTDGAGIDEPVSFTRASLRHATRAARLCGLAAEGACEEARCPTGSLSCVFSSALGELEITDQICSILAEQPLALSPVLFHNSVHNAAAGYWSIASQSRNPCRAVAAGPFSFAMGFLTAIGQIQTEPETPVLYVYYEMAVPNRFRQVYDSPRTRATAFILESDDHPGPESGPGPLLHFQIGTRSAHDSPDPALPSPGPSKPQAPTLLEGTFPLSEEHHLVLHLTPHGPSPA